MGPTAKPWPPGSARHRLASFDIIRPTGRYKLGFSTGLGLSGRSGWWGPKDDSTQERSRILRREARKEGGRTGRHHFRTAHARPTGPTPGSMATTEGLRLGDAVHEDVGERRRHLLGREAPTGLQPQIGVVVHAEPGPGGQPRIELAE